MNQVVLLIAQRKLGINGIRAAKRRTLFNLILITLVVAVLIVAQIFVVSMSQGITDKYALLGDGHLQIFDRVPQNLSHSGILDLQHVAQVDALLYSADGNRMVRLKGVGPTYFNDYRRSAITFKTLSQNDSSALGRITLSATLADELNVTLGERIAVMLVSSSSIRPQLLIVDRLYDSGYRELDEYLAFCDYALIQRLFGGEQVEYTEVLTDRTMIDRTKRALIDDGFRVKSWDEQNPIVATNLQTSKQAILGVMLGVAILCGYFISELSRQMVEDDRQGIATLALIGTPKRVVGRSYFVVVMVITLGSMVLGALLGFAVATAIPPLLGALAKRSFPALSFYLLDFLIIYPYRDILLIILALVATSAVSVGWSLRRVRAIEPLNCIRFD